MVTKCGNYDVRSSQQILVGMDWHETAVLFHEEHHNMQSYTSILFIVHCHSGCLL